MNHRKHKRKQLKIEVGAHWHSIVAHCGEDGMCAISSPFPSRYRAIQALWQHPRIKGQHYSNPKVGSVDVLTVQDVQDINCSYS